VLHVGWLLPAALAAATACGSGGGSGATPPAQGATVDLRVVEHEDHFLFFDRDEQVLATVEEWMDGVSSRSCKE
jgi:hypothetical protein